MLKAIHDQGSSHLKHSMHVLRSSGISLFGTLSSKAGMHKELTSYNCPSSGMGLANDLPLMQPDGIATDGEASASVCGK